MKKFNVIAVFFCLVFFLCGCTSQLQQKENFEEIDSESVVTESEESDAVQSETLRENVQRILQNQEDNTGPVSDSEPEDSVLKEQEPEASDTDSFTEGGYYYSALSDEEKKVYEEIYKATVNYKEMELSTLSVDLIEKINLCVTSDHPEIFNVYGYTYTTHTRGDELVSILYRAKYNYDEAEAARLETAIEDEVGRILSFAPVNGTDFEKIKFVYDTLVNNTDYREDAKDNQNIASVFLYHESVCQGYAKATQYLLNRLCIEATLVLGETDSGAHSWNLVKADGAWYYLDTTWGDADFQHENQEAVEQNARPVSYDYFLVDSNTLLSTHTPKKTVPLPECTAKDNNYYIHENLYLTGLDTEIIRNIFQSGYDNNEDAVQFKCSNQAVFEQVKNYLIEEQHIFDFIKSSGSVSYTVFEDTNTFCFWLFNS